MNVLSILGTKNDSYNFVLIIDLHAFTLQSWYRGRSIAFRARNQCRNDLVSKLHDLQRVSGLFVFDETRLGVNENLKLHCIGFHVIVL